MVTSGQTVVQHGEEEEEDVQTSQHYQQVVEGVSVECLLYFVQHTPGCNRFIVQCILIF